MIKYNNILAWREIVRITDAVCRRYNLTYGDIVPETDLRVRYYGEARACDICIKNCRPERCREKTITIRIHQYKKPHIPLSNTTIIRTLAHELAHLDPRCWHHSKEHKQLTDEIIKFIKNELIK